MVAQLDRPIMRLVNDTDDEPALRISPKSIRQVARATRLDHAIKARQNPLLQLVIRQVSDEGATGTSDQPLDPEERLSVLFPSRGFTAAWSAVGRVVQCEPIGDGYKVAIQFDMTPSAA